jgi:hypothetical protein
MGKTTQNNTQKLPMADMFDLGEIGSPEANLTGQKYQKSSREAK